MLDPTDGTITVDGRNLTRILATSRFLNTEQNVGVVFQDFRLLKGEKLFLKM